MSPNSETCNTLQPPEWLNHEFFTKVLHSCKDSDKAVKVKNFKITPATMPGDNLASIIFRAKVQYESTKLAHLESISMVIKTEQEELAKEMANKDPSANLFAIEVAMYTKVLPRFHQLLREAGDDSVLGPRCLYHSFKPHNLIVLEDIVPLGYSMVRGRGMSLDEIKCAYRKLAKWHALSYKINQEKPDFFDLFRNAFVHWMVNGMHEFTATGLQLLIQMLETQPQLRQYKPYFEAMQPDLIEKCIATGSEYRTQPQPNTHYVLCHGDFHYKNMMFKWNERNQVEDVMLLDYQVSYMGSMDLDIIYSMIMLLTKEQRLYHLDELIYHYFSTFLETLKRVGYMGEMPKMLEFHQMMTRHSCFQILLMATFLPFWYASQATKMDINGLIGPTEVRRHWYYAKEYITELEEWLPMLLHKGILGN